MSTQAPVVSVVLPTRDRAELLPRAVASVLGQTFSDFELIVVDDASSDATACVVSAFADPRIAYLRLDAPRGPGAARNVGIRAARGKYVAFQDSDDEWLPDKLARQVDVFDGAPREVGLVYSRFVRIDGTRTSETPPAGFQPGDAGTRRALLRGNFIGTPTVMARAECLAGDGLFDEGLRMLEDWELWLRLSRRCESRFIDETLVRTYRTPGGVNDQHPVVMCAAFRTILRRHRDLFADDRRLLAGHYSHVGKLFCRHGRVGKGLACLAEVPALMLA